MWTKFKNKVYFANFFLLMEKETMLEYEGEAGERKRKLELILQY